MWNKPNGLVKRSTWRARLTIALQNFAKCWQIPLTNSNIPLIPQRMRGDNSEKKVGKKWARITRSPRGVTVRVSLSWNMNLNMKKNKMASRITVNTAYSKLSRQLLGRMTPKTPRPSHFNDYSQPAELFIQRSPFAMLKRTDVCRQEWPSSSRLCANFVTISVEPLLHTPLFYRNPALLRVHVIGRSEAQTSQTRCHVRRSHPRSGAKGKPKNLRNLHRMQHVWSPAVSLFWKLSCFGAFYRFRWQDYLSRLRRDLSSFALWHFVWK